MSDDTLRRGFKALDAIGCLRRDPPPPSASPAHEESFTTYAWDSGDRRTDCYWIRAMAAWRQIASHKRPAPTPTRA